MMPSNPLKGSRGRHRGAEGRAEVRDGKAFFFGGGVEGGTWNVSHLTPYLQQTFVSKLFCFDNYVHNKENVCLDLTNKLYI